MAGIAEGIPEAGNRLGRGLGAGFCDILRLGGAGGRRPAQAERQAGYREERAERLKQCCAGNGGWLGSHRRRVSQEFDGLIADPADKASVARLQWTL